MALRVFERWLPLKRDLVLRAFSGSLRPLLLLVRGQSGYAAYTSGTSTPFSELLNLERRASLREAAQQLSELCALEEAITKHLDTEQSKYVKHRYHFDRAFAISYEIFLTRLSISADGGPW
jgi:hypothetical protein